MAAFQMATRRKEKDSGQRNVQVVLQGDASKWSVTCSEMLILAPAKEMSQFSSLGHSLEFLYRIDLVDLFL